MPLRNPKIELKEPIVLWSDCGIRGDRRLEKGLRMDAPSGPLKVREMVLSALSSGEAPGQCVKCKSLEGTTQCCVCLLSWHQACIAQCHEELQKTIHPPTPRGCNSIPLVLHSRMCALCEMIIMGSAQEAASPSPGFRSGPEAPTAPQPDTMVALSKPPSPPAPQPPSPPAP